MRCALISAHVAVDDPDAFSWSRYRRAATRRTANPLAALLLSGPRFVDAQRPSAEVFAVELCYGRFGFALVRHLDEAEPARASRLAIHEDLDGRNCTKRTEGIAKLVFAHAIGQIAYVDIHHRDSHAVHETPDEALNQRREIERWRQELYGRRLSAVNPEILSV